MSDKLAKICQLNDHLRQALQDRYGSKVIITRGVAHTAPDLLNVYNAVRTFNDWGQGNDPYKEHDFGSVFVDGIQYFWKIDYYAKDMEHGSEDPSDPTQTTRVLTIMLASEY